MTLQLIKTAQYQYRFVFRAQPRCVRLTRLCKTGVAYYAKLCNWVNQNQNSPPLAAHMQGFLNKDRKLGLKETTAIVDTD